MDDDKMALTRVEQLLEENLELAKENNRLIREVRRTGRVSFWFRLALWAIVLILPFLLIGPILQALVPSTGGADGGSIFGLPSGSQIQEIFESYQAQLGGEE